ncbi:MAG: biotin/lipoyl-binding protein [Candidatus Eiseniibacteriota bacterium]|nr:MAG: biotin/lipoyl-binding protein [Candidatus Eisenbacteria bacterium]
MKYIAWIDGKQHKVEVELRNGMYVVTLDGKKHRVDARKLAGSSVYSMLIAGKSYEADVRHDGDSVNVSVHGESYRISISEELWARVGSATESGPRRGTHQLKAPMPGLVVQVGVKEGQRVQEGEPLVIIEAMKMQNELCAQSAGIVKEINVKEQDAVDPDQVLLVIES